MRERAPGSCFITNYDKMKFVVLGSMGQRNIDGNCMDTGRGH